jgi:hypothetical protein
MTDVRYNPASGVPPKPGKFYNRKGEYIGDRPFGPVLLKHRAAAAILGVRPKELLRMNVKRAFYANTYVYDPVEICALAGIPIPPPTGTTNNNVME